MILIDKYELLKEVAKRKYSAASMRLINEQPEVKAIPVEWIDGYIKGRANDVNIYAEILFISDMVKEWEKENETN